MNDQEFADLLDFFGGSRKGYRKVRKGVKKRVGRHMQELGCRRVDEYIRRLGADAAAREECRRRMSVPISRFLRDRRLWEILRDRLLPELVEEEPEMVSVWSAGCAGGEEVYSFRMIWEELSDRYAGFPGLEIIATDLNPNNLERAEKGIYPPGSLREVSEAWRKRFFEKKGGQFVVRSDLAEDIDWRIQDLLGDEPPGRQFDVVFLRNSILTYQEAESRDHAFFRIIGALRVGGFLVTGAREKIPPGGKKFLSSYDMYIYRKIGKSGEYRR